MTSKLKEEWITRPKKVHGFTGVSAYFEVGNAEHLDRICIVAENEDVLFRILKDFMPEAQISGSRFQKVTVIQAKP